MAFRLSVDRELLALAARTDHRVLARWARACARRVLAYFEQRRPRDGRPRAALDALSAWIRTGKFHMAAIRKASLGASTYALQAIHRAAAPGRATAAVERERAWQRRKLLALRGA